MEKNTTKSKETGVPELTVPSSVLEETGIAACGSAEARTFSHGVVLIKDKLTAMEMIESIDELRAVADGLVSKLLELCGPCHECGECPDDGYDGEEGSIRLPARLLEKAGIAPEAKLNAIADPATGFVVISKADFKNELSDVPIDLFDELVADSICLAALDKLLKKGGVVYGK